MENSNYKICNKTIYFSYNFDIPLSSCPELIKDMNILIFEDGKYAGTNSKYNYLIILTPCTSILKFGFSFDIPIVLSLGVQYLKFGCNFGHPIILTPKIKFLSFGWDFDQPIVLPQSIIHLTFEHAFNHPIILTSRITHLRFGTNFNQLINLTKKITHLTLGGYFDKPIVFHSKIIHLSFGFFFNQFVVLPPNIRFLSITCNSNNNYKIIDNLPNSIRLISIGHYTSKFFSNNIPNNTMLEI